MKNIDVEAFKKAWFTYDEIESVKKWLEDVEKGRVYTEQEFYSKLENTLFSNNKINV